MGEFVHAPSDARSRLPTHVCPEMVGAATFTGGGGGIGLGATTDVAADVAEDWPELFAAVTSTRSVRPTSAEPSVYCDAVAPAIDAQLPPDVSQRRHWYEWLVP